MSTVTDGIPKAPSKIGRFFGGLGLIRESWIGTVGLIILLFWVAMAILAPVLPLFDPNAQIVPMQTPMAVAPDGESTFWLGTDAKGRDILSRIIWGSQRVLFWASLATFVAYVVGMTMGA
ncbi:MAG: ABC transporter permease, partial [Alphaproteobacteria bacterium]|nr:ABC transporter permease [Alphaproteobacteria bacterium]